MKKIISFFKSFFKKTKRIKAKKNKSLEELIFDTNEFFSETLESEMLSIDNMITLSLEEINENLNNGLYNNSFFLFNNDEFNFDETSDLLKFNLLKYEKINNIFGKNNFKPFDFIDTSLKFFKESSINNIDLLKTNYGENFISDLLSLDFSPRERMNAIKSYFEKQKYIKNLSDNILFTINLLPLFKEPLTKEEIVKFIENNNSEQTQKICDVLNIKTDDINKKTKQDIKNFSQLLFNLAFYSKTKDDFRKWANSYHNPNITYDPFVYDNFAIIDDFFRNSSLPKILERDFSFQQIIENEFREK